jgi:hypothetical protein
LSASLFKKGLSENLLRKGFIANFLEKNLIKNHALTKTAWSSGVTLGDKPAQRFQLNGLESTTLVKFI